MLNCVEPYFSQEIMWLCLFTEVHSSISNATAVDCKGGFEESKKLTPPNQLIYWTNNISCMEANHCSATTSKKILCSSSVEIKAFTQIFQNDNILFILPIILSASWCSFVHPLSVLLFKHLMSTSLPVDTVDFIKEGRKQCNFFKRRILPSLQRII